MDQALVREWVKALRSGEYRQRHGQLRRGDAYCCLGVAADVAIKTGKTPLRWEGDGLNDDRSFLSIRDPDLQDALGINGRQNCLTNLNDNEGATFPVIADWIETHILNETPTERP